MILRIIYLLGIRGLWGRDSDEGGEVEEAFGRYDQLLKR